MQSDKSITGAKVERQGTTAIMDMLSRDRPSFHFDGKGGFTSWNSNTNLLRWIEINVTAGMRTLEIGSGYSTVVFLGKGCRHTIVTPVQEEADRISEYCRAAGIQTDSASFLISESFRALPSMDEKEYELIFIDGAHSFPFPIVDWFFCTILLKSGGLIIIDDTHLISCHMLARFMLNDPHWEEIEARENFAIFRKLRDPVYPMDWPSQPFSAKPIEVKKDLLSAFYPPDRRKSEKKIDVSNIEPLPPALTSSLEVSLPLSVVICTLNRADLLARVLDGLTVQSLGRESFEVVVINDGSTDGTEDVCSSFMERLPLRYFYQRNAGLASAKNHGIYAARGEIVLFLDDDDIPAPDLLQEHLRIHRKYPAKYYAVLHHTEWAPELAVTPLMHFVTEVGCFLFSYPSLKDRQVLDYTYFWGGRSSCKRSFLIEHGVFNPVFRFGCEDIELGYRLSKHGLKVVYTRRGVSRMVRPITFDAFCERLLKQGRSQYIFSALHDDPGVRHWTEVKDAAEKWNELKDAVDKMIKSARDLNLIANTKEQHGLPIDDMTKRLLYRAYWAAFRACKLKGIAEKREEAEHGKTEQPEVRP